MPASELCDSIDAFATLVHHLAPGLRNGPDLPRMRTDGFARLQWCILPQHDDLGADVDAGKQVNDILVGHADTTGRDEFADGRGIVGAVNTVLAGAEIHGACPERVAGTARDETRQVRLA